MSLPESNEVQIEYRDVPDYFSNEEWMVLHEWQKELYRNVMEEIHKALISLGPLIATTLFSLRSKEKEHLCRMDSLDSERQHQIDNSTDMLYKINKEEYIHRNNYNDSEKRERNANASLSGEFPLLKSEVPLIKQEEPVSVFADHQDHCADPESAYEIVSFCINDEEDAYCMESNRTENIKQPPVGVEANHGKPNSRDSLKAKPSKVSSGFANASMEGIDCGNQLWSNIQHQLPGAEMIQCDSDVSNRAHLPFYPDASGGQTTEVDPGERKYQCPKCEKSFKRKDNLNVHQRTHTGERPYRCMICMRSFNQKGILNRHHIIHTRKKHYQCSQCGRKCIDKKTLLEHRKVHKCPNTGEDPRCID